MLSEISQVVKDKYHMTSLLSGTYSTKQTSRENRTRNVEIKNKLTVTREERGKKGKCHQGTCVEDPWTKPTGGRIEGGRWELVGQGKLLGGKWRQLLLEQ